MPAACRPVAPQAIAALAVRFARCEAGVTAMIWAFTFAAFLMGVALAIDYGLAVTEKQREQHALDAATLAATQHVGQEDAETKVPEAVVAYYKENRLTGGGSTIKSSSYNAETGEIVATAGTSLKAKLMRGAGYENAKFDIATRSKVVKGAGSIEIALVLDNSGSMGGSSGSVNGTYIEDLKEAAANLVGTMFAGAEGTERVKVGLVPFAASVNVGPVNRGADWIDNDGQSSIHMQNFVDASRSRFQLFDDMGVAWKGCVETRPGPLDTSDTPASGGTADTLFVPMFAPDEPDDANASAAGLSNYPNNYISDFGGSCPQGEQVCVKYNKKKGRCDQYGPAPIGVAEAQARVCKYQGAVPNADTGPNAGCTTAPILPLNSLKQDVLDAIGTMQASGNTNIGEGVMWGWRVLSPGVPFTEGGEAAGDLRKFMVVMTDGENFLSANSNHNKSVYAAHGYAAKGRLGGTYSQSGYTSHLNGKLLTACDNAKREGITVFTVAFRLEDNPTTQELLRGCATTPDQAFRAGDGEALMQSFHNIGRQISQTRIAE